MLNAKKAVARRHAIAVIAALPWWASALDGYAQPAPVDVTPRGLAPLPPLNIRVNGTKNERGGLSLDIATMVESGGYVPIVLFVDPSKLAGRTVARLGVVAPLNPRPVVLEMELGSFLAQPRLSTSIRLGASQGVIGVAQLSDGTLWQHTIDVHLTGSACFDGT